MSKSILKAVALTMFALMPAGPAAVGAAGKESENAWSFEMWCLEMQLYPAKRCDARTQEDLREYQQYRAEVEAYHQTQQQKQKRDSEILQHLNQNLPGSAPGR